MLKLIPLLLLTVSGISRLPAQAVAVSPDGAPADPSAMLDVRSEEKGMLIPRMTTTQREMIASPAVGLLVFDTETESFWFNETAGWVELRDGNIDAVVDEDGDTRVTVETFPDEDRIRFKLAGTERWMMQGTGLLARNTGGSIFIGEAVGQNDNGLGNRNIAFGDSAFVYSTSGVSNVAVGALSLRVNLSGSRNTGVGYGTLTSNTSGSYNSVVGYNAMGNNVSGANNCAMGAYALARNTTGWWNAAFGPSALVWNATGSRNTAVGNDAMHYNMEGESNAAVGAAALFNNRTGHRNVAIGYEALYSSKYVSSNVAVGDSALRQSNGLLNDEATQLVAVGAKALLANAVGYANTAVGYEALRTNNGNLNTALGVSALDGNTAGDKNTAVGNEALRGNTNGNENTCIGYNADVSGPSLQNATAIGANALVSLSNSLVLGNNANVGIGLSSPGNRLDIRMDGTADTATILLGLISDISNRPVIQFSEGTSAGPTSGMSIEYNGVGASSDNKLHFRGTDAVRKFTFMSAGYMGIGTETSDRELLVADVGNNGDAIIEMQTVIGGSKELIVGLNQSVGGILGTVSNTNMTIRTNNTTRVTVSNIGDVGIGTGSPSEKLHVAGNICYTGSIAACSDIRYKKDILPVGDVLSRIASIGAYTYAWDTTSFPDRGFNDEPQLGVIAQELEEQFPQLVRTDQEGYKSVDYAKLSVILLEGMKEQQEMIDALNQRMEEMERELGVKN